MIFIKLHQKEKNVKIIHPLFLTRGVPGTHDCKMLYNTIKILKKKKFLNLLKFLNLTNQLMID